MGNLDDNFYKQAIGKSIRKIRKKTKLTQEAFAEKIGIEPSSLSNIENGKSYPSVSTIIQIQKNFNVTSEDIFNIDYEIEINKISENLHEKINSLALEKQIALLKIINLIEA